MCNYRDMICVYDKHLKDRDIQCQAPDSRSRYTTPFNDFYQFIYCALVGVSAGRGTLHLYELVGVIVKVGVSVVGESTVGQTTIGKKT